MAWYRNFYECARCGSEWADTWSCACDDDCPHCGARHMAPHQSDDLTTIIEECGHEFVVLWSPETAEHMPDYSELASFQTRKQAEDFVATG